MKNKKLWIFIALALVILVCNHIFGWSEYVSGDTVLGYLHNMVKENPVLAVVIYIVASSVGSVLLAIPGVTFAIVAGVVFGPVQGTLFCLIASTLGAMAAFLVGRFFLQDSIKPLAMKNKYIKKWLFDESGKNEILVLLITRMVPLFPYNLQNFAYGVTDISFRSYSICSFLFMLPGTAMYTFGTAGIVDEANRGMYIAVAAVLAVLVFGVAALLKRRYDLEGKRSKVYREPTTISVIIPVYNEESTLPVLLPQLTELLGHCELIFVDGKSEDNSVSQIRQWIQQQENTGEIQLLFSSKGRADQMNFGAEHSHGDILFFLHCDSILPKQPLEQIRQVMERYRMGCFGVGFHSRNFFMLTNRVISNHRAKHRHLIFGDQGMFIRRELFIEAGMFPDIPLMEDYQFCLTMREKREPVGFTKNRIYTSDRRYPKGTINKLKVMWQMNRLRKMYREGVPVDQIAALYGDIR